MSLDCQHNCIPLMTHCCTLFQTTFSRVKLGARDDMMRCYSMHPDGLQTMVHPFFPPSLRPTVVQGLLPPSLTSLPKLPHPPTRDVWLRQRYLRPEKCSFNSGGL